MMGFFHSYQHRDKDMHPLIEIRQQMHRKLDKKLVDEVDDRKQQALIGSLLKETDHIAT
jgi:hypothetical protein